MKGSTNSNHPISGYIKMNINLNQKLSATWTAIWLNCTYNESHDVFGLFTPETNGVRINRNGIYQITASLGLRGGDASYSTQNSIDIIRQRNNAVTALGDQRIQCNRYDISGIITQSSYCLAGDLIIPQMNGDTLSAYTEFQAECWMTVAYIGE